MTDMTESTEPPAFKRQKDGSKLTVKISLCNCVVLSWDELKGRQNLFVSDYEIFMVCLLVGTVYQHKSLQFVKKSNITLLPWVPVSLSFYISCMTSVTHKFKDVSIFEIPRDGFFSASHDIQKNLSGTTACRKLKIHKDSFAGRSQRMVKRVNLIDKPLTDLGNYLLCKRLILHANMEIYCSFKSFAGGTWGFSYREDRSCISQVVPLHSCKKDISNHLRSCKFSDSENEVDLILSLAGIFETPTNIDYFTICPTHRC